MLAARDEHYKYFSAVSMVGTKSYKTKSSCYGDSGGPLIFKDSAGKMVQIGIVSWATACGKENIPFIYTRLATPTFINWIKKIILN